MLGSGRLTGASSLREDRFEATKDAGVSRTSESLLRHVARAGGKRLAPSVRPARRPGAFRAEVAFATAGVVLAPSTILWSDWIEIVFRVDPDRGSGTLERAIVAAPLVLALCFGNRLIVWAEHGRPERL